MFYKHWKSIALSLTAIFWGGCNNHSSSSEEPIACTLKSYTHDTVDCGHYTTTKNQFYCEDGLECIQHPECDRNIYCHDKQNQRISYTEEEFKSKYHAEQVPLFLDK